MRERASRHGAATPGGARSQCASAGCSSGDSKTRATPLGIRGKKERGAFATPCVHAGAYLGAFGRADRQASRDVTMPAPGRGAGGCRARARRRSRGRGEAAGSTRRVVLGQGTRLFPDAGPDIALDLPRAATRHSIVPGAGSRELRYQSDHSDFRTEITRCSTPFPGPGSMTKVCPSSWSGTSETTALCS